MVADHFSMAHEGFFLLFQLRGLGTRKRLDLLLLQTEEDIMCLSLFLLLCRYVSPHIQ